MLRRYLIWAGTYSLKGSQCSEGLEEEFRVQAEDTKLQMCMRCLKTSKKASEAEH